MAGVLFFFNKYAVILVLHLHPMSLQHLVGVGTYMSLVWISNIVVSCFEEWVMSLLLFNPSSCRLSPFLLVLCGCFTPMSLVGNFTLTGPHKHLSRCKLINSMQLVERGDCLSNLMMLKNILLLLVQRMMESCKVVLAYECVNEILWCIHLNETSHL